MDYPFIFFWKQRCKEVTGPACTGATNNISVYILQPHYISEKNIVLCTPLYLDLMMKKKSLNSAPQYGDISWPLIDCIEERNAGRLPPIEDWLAAWSKCYCSWEIKLQILRSKNCFKKLLDQNIWPVVAGDIENSCHQNWNKLVNSCWVNAINNQIPGVISRSCSHASLMELFPVVGRLLSFSHSLLKVVNFLFAHR